MTLSAISTVMYNIILLINTTVISINYSFKKYLHLVSMSYIKILIQSIKNLK
ncbi:hypothetical protein QSQ_1823 [Clostridioides difficile P32]|nr:hypothetical protein QMA_1884 [Clostridioides difficile DA00244]EQJ46796.1 hypothetical protein QSG_2140 [Clostridioides difficile P25]EQJ60422.1 hypothetical protein QSQ_1823 [Clostridioides difficile P32]